MAWRPEQKIQGGKYIIEKRIGLGAFTITYRARDKDENLYAIKTLNDNVQCRPYFPKYQEVFLKEARELAQITHPNMAQVIDICLEGRVWCLVTEYILGHTLDFRLNNGGALQENVALDYIHEIGGVLLLAHKNGILHQDVRPLNIKFPRGENEAILTGFGFCREFMPDRIEGPPQFFAHGYAPVEQYSRKTPWGTHTEVYSLAATLYAMLTAKAPPPSPDRVDEIEEFKRDPLTAARKINPKVTKRVNQAILKGLALQPEDRPQTVEEWLDLIPRRKPFSPYGYRGLPKPIPTPKT